MLALSLSLSYVRTEQEDGCLQARKRASTRGSNQLELFSWIPQSQNWRNKSLLFNRASLWYSVTAVQAKTIFQYTYCLSYLSSVLHKLEPLRQG